MSILSLTAWMKLISRPRVQVDPRWIFSSSDSRLLHLRVCFSSADQRQTSVECCQIQSRSRSRSKTSKLISNLMFEARLLFRQDYKFILREKGLIHSIIFEDKRMEYFFGLLSHCTNLKK